jgi:hypothetical protein
MIRIISRYGAITSLALSLIVNTGPAEAQLLHQQSAQSVVKITCRLPSGKSMNSTGFIWSKNSWVVTALHGVAGCASIAVYSEKLMDQTAARVIAAHHSSDLALLELEGNMELPPLVHSIAEPDLQEKYYIWGYPKNIPTLKGDPLTFSQGLSRNTTLGKAFFRTKNDFDKQVGDQGYPRFDTTIIRVGSTLQNGHSGAPIFDSQGRVVAIADGGLYQGTAGISWSIPAAKYLPKLPTSRDDIPGLPSRSATLMSSVAEDDTSISFDLEDGGTGMLEHVWQIPITELADLIFEEDLQEYDESLETIALILQGTGVGLEDYSIDVFVETRTGATLAVPSNMALEWDPEYGYMEVLSDSGETMMLVAIMRTASWEDALAELDSVVSYLEELGDWEEDEEYPAEEEMDETEQWMWAAVDLVEIDDAGEQSAYASVYFQVEGTDLLATAVMQYEYLDSMTRETRINLELLWLSERLTAFSKR